MKWGLQHMQGLEIRDSYLKVFRTLIAVLLIFLLYTKWEEIKGVSESYGIAFYLNYRFMILLPFSLVVFQIAEFKIPKMILLSVLSVGTMMITNIYWLLYVKSMNVTFNVYIWFLVAITYIIMTFYGIYKRSKL
jgi:predicted neutral ceramidase superfamily lipid hydrolase